MVPPKAFILPDKILFDKGLVIINSNVIVREGINPVKYIKVGLPLEPV